MGNSLTPDSPIREDT